MKRINSVSCALIVLITATAFISAVHWQIQDDRYTIKFDTKKASGTIQGLKGTIQFDSTDLAHSSMQVTVDVNTLNTGNNLKNQHAKARDYFNAEQYPTIGFATSSISKTETGFLASGNLTIKDISREVAIPFAFIQKEGEGRFEGSFTFDTEDFGLKKNGVGGIVKVELLVPVKK